VNEPADQKQVVSQLQLESLEKLSINFSQPKMCHNTKSVLRKVIAKTHLRFLACCMYAVRPLMDYQFLSVAFQQQHQKKFN